MTNNLKHIIMPDGTKLDLPTGVNNVYSYGMSQYYKGIMNNNSWLRSSGQWNSGAVYTGIYNWIVEQANKLVYNGGLKVYGNPTITDSGVASNFSTDDYLQTPRISYESAGLDSIAFDITFTPSETQTNTTIFDSSTGWKLVYVDDNNLQATSNEGYTYTVETTESMVGKVCKANIYSNLMGQGLKVTVGTNKYTGDEQSEIVSLIGARELVIGTGYYSGGDPFKGSIDLPSIKVTINGSVVFSVDTVRQAVDGFKLSTEEYTDYDWVLNTTDGTFRLPLKNGSEDLPSNKYENLTLSNNDSSYTAPANGYYTLSKGGDVGTYIQYASNNKGDRAYSSSANSDIWLSSKLLKEGDTITWSYTASGTTNLFRFVYAQGNGNLYYYIGDVLQNADLINIARIQETLADKTNTVQASLASAPSDVYDDLTLLASGQTYNAPETGWFFLDKIAGSAGGYVAITNSTTDLGSINDGYSATRACKAMLKVAKGDTVKVEYTATGNTRFFRFYYDVGVKSNKAS